MNTIHDLAQVACDYSGVTPRLLYSACRTKRVSRVRWALWWVCRNSGWSQQQLAQALGRHDHATVCRGLQRAAELVKAPGWFLELVNHVEAYKAVQGELVLLERSS